MDGVAVDRRPWTDYLTLTKPGISSMVVLTAAMAFILASHGAVNVPLLLITILGTGLCSGGANALNMLMEKATDGLMARTRMRPLPAGRLSSAQALLFGAALCVTGVTVLLVGVNLPTGGLAILTILFYLAAYTPLKKKTWLCVAVGAVPGAVPPLMGWAAAGHGIGAGAWLLFAILFLWQFPHFMALSWMYREDYQRAGLPMLSVVDPSGKTVAAVGLIFTVGLVGVSLAPGILRNSGVIVPLSIAVLGLGFLVAAVVFSVHRSIERARWFFLTSVTYLPLILGIMAAQATLWAE